MNYQVVVSAPAHNDLVDVRSWVAAEATIEVAERYIDRITSRFERLAYFPNRGTPRPDLAPGIRTIPFERRLLIAFSVEGDLVTILRVVDASRDLTRVFS